MKRISLSFTGGCDGIDTYVDGAKAAERHGYEAVWLAEDYFMRDTFTLSAAVARATTDVNVGAFVNPFTRHPVVTAESVATLQEMTDADVQVAFGAGPGIVMEQFVDYDRPLWQVKEAIDLFRATMSGEAVDFDGDHFEVSDVTLGECPYLPFLDGFEAPDEVPSVYVAAQGPQMLKMAGDVGDGLLISVGYTPQMAEETVEGARKGLAIADRDEESYDVGGLITSAQEIDGKVRQFAAMRVAGSLSMDDLRRLGFDEDAVRPVREAYEEDGLEAAAGHVTDDLAEEFVLITGKEGYRDRLDEYVAAGVDVPVLFALDEDNVEEIVAAGAEWASEE